MVLKMKVNYVKTDIKSIINVSKIVTIHYYEFDKNFAFNGESHNFWEMVYVDKGKVLVSCNNNAVELSQGDIIFHKPNELHSHMADGENTPNVFILSFVCKSRAMPFFENRKVKLGKDLARFVYHIFEEGKRILPCDSRGRPTQSAPVRHGKRIREQALYTNR